MRSRAALRANQVIARLIGESSSTYKRNDLMSGPNSVAEMPVVPVAHAKGVHRRDSIMKRVAELAIIVIFLGIASWAQEIRHELTVQASGFFTKQTTFLK
jgi:hypothetical protein